MVITHGCDCMIVGVSYDILLGLYLHNLQLFLWLTLSLFLYIQINACMFSLLSCGCMRAQELRLGSYATP